MRDARSRGHLQGVPYSEVFNWRTEDTSGFVERADDRATTAIAK